MNDKTKGTLTRMDQIKLIEKVVDGFLKKGLEGKMTIELKETGGFNIEVKTELSPHWLAERPPVDAISKGAGPCRCNDE